MFYLKEEFDIAIGAPHFGNIIINDNLGPLHEFHQIGLQISLNLLVLIKKMSTFALCLHSSVLNIALAI